MTRDLPLFDLDDDLVPVPGDGHQVQAALSAQGTPAVDDANLAPTVTLAFGDLLPDANGEVVILGGGEPAQINLLTDQQVAESGVAGDHVTLDGVDVHGLSFFAFESGLRLFYPTHWDIVLGPVDG